MASNTLIIGSDGKIGSPLASRLRQAGRNVIGTTRRKENVSPSCIYLDMALAMDSWQPPEGIDAAVICAGVSSVGACSRDPEGSEQVNVHDTTVLANKLAESGAFVIFLSSGHVFSGDKPHHEADESYSPITEYGRQKAQAESNLANLGDSVGIVRLSNVIGPDDPLLSGWAESLKQQEVVTPFEDMTFAPVPLACVISVLQLILDFRLSGIWQVSGERDISYADVARIGSDVFGVSRDLVQPIRAADAGYTDPIRKNTTLDVTRLRQELGIQPPNVLWTLEEAFINLI